MIHIKYTFSPSRGDTVRQRENKYIPSPLTPLPKGEGDKGLKICLTISQKYAIIKS